MNLPDLRYSFHDSLLEKVEVGPRREITLHIILYSIYYKDTPTVRVRFGAIANFDSVCAFVEEVREEWNEDEEGYIRIGALKYDSEKPSKANALFFRLLLDCGDIGIHCGKLNVDG